MNLPSAIKKRLPAFFFEPRGAEGQDRLNYRGIWNYSILGMISVSVLPMIVLAGISFYQYTRALKAEALHPMHLLVSNNRRAIAFFLDERLSALNFLVQDQTIEELRDPVKLKDTLDHLKTAFGGFVDLGVVDSSGLQINYSGPYDFKGLDYRDQEWFRDVVRTGAHVSEVFKGYRGFPHIVLATKYRKAGEDFHVLRATLDTAGFNEVIRAMDLSPTSDNFLINNKGVLQTSSKSYGEVLEKVSLDLPRASDRSEVVEMRDDRGQPVILALARVDASPFIFAAVKSSGELQEKLDGLLRELIIFLALGLLVVILVIWRVSTWLVGHIHRADRQRTLALHEVEYINKMASIGRLAAGVAHEINNPLAIINEKGGLLKDLVQYSPDSGSKEKYLKLVESILGSVKRCSTITHRLLGFARHLEVQAERIAPLQLLEEVLGFLVKPAAYQNVALTLEAPPDLPEIISDRGQLQQVFLNIINNAIEAVSENGSVVIRVETPADGGVAVSIRDSGPGITPENLARVFEPFFSTKGRRGTGLGLSITYGIVKKLGGEIAVESQVGEGTMFTVVLPARSPEPAPGV